MKNTLQTLLLAAALLASLPLHGQRIHGFVSSGATLSQVEGDELKGFRKWGYTGGVGAIAALDRHGDWNLSVEALFSQRGSYNGTGNPYSLDLTLNYADIPLMVHYRDPWGGMFFGLGLNYSRLTNQARMRIRYPDSFFPDTNDLKFLSNDLGVVADLRFFVWRKLMLNIRWQYSLIAVKRDWHFKQSDGNEPKRDAEGNIVTDADGTVQMQPKWKTFINDCQNNSLSIRLLWVF